jgi:hypothetical protein
MTKPKSTPPAHEFDLHAYLDRFAAIVRKTPGVTGDWMVDPYWCGSRWAHAMICGALVRAVPEHLTPLVEAAMYREFRPDMTIIDSGRKEIAVIEYESVNSSDRRLITRDVPRFAKGYTLDGEWPLPKLWLIISTLPSIAVNGWPWHAVNRLADPAQNKASRAKRNANPLAFFQATMHAAMKEQWAMVRSQHKGFEAYGARLVWANIDRNELKILNVNGRVAQEEVAWRLFGN